MEGVEEVRQLDDRRLHWVAEFGGERHEWDAEIVEQRPEERVAWRNTDGKDNAGVVTFHTIDDDTTRLAVQMDFVPEGLKRSSATCSVSPTGASGATSSASKSSSSRAARRPARGAAKCPATANWMTDPTCRGGGDLRGDARDERPVGARGVLFVGARTEGALA